MRSVSPTIRGDAVAVQAMAIPPCSTDYLQDDAARVASRRLGHIRVNPNQNWSCGFLPRLASVRGRAAKGSRNLRVRAVMAAPRSFIPKPCGSNRWLDLTLADQDPEQFAGHAKFKHFSFCLSKASSSAGSTTSSKRGQSIGNAGQVGAA